jgi:hypothetical protein
MYAFLYSIGVIYSIQAAVPWKSNRRNDIHVFEALVYSSTERVEHVLLPLPPRDSGALKWFQ